MTATPGDEAAPAGGVRCLEVEIAWSEPRIWRRLQVRGSATLDHLHEVLQAAFGWQDCHLHAFETAFGAFGRPDWGQFDVVDSTLVQVHEAAEVGGTFRYTYDFNSDWEHLLTVVAALDAEPGVRYPRCVAGERADPIEDVGGLARYELLAAALSDKEHPEHETYLAALDDGASFDPARFSLDDVNRRMAVI